MENLQRDRETTLHTLNKLTKDDSSYKGQLQFDKDGIKSNPIQLEKFNSADAEEIGTYLIKLSATWKPNTDEDDTLKIGKLYGFDLYIRRQKQAYEDKGMFEYHYQNMFYSQSKETDIKYSWNQGHINIDNPKIAARYFLNAIDRVEALKEKYQKNLHELDQNIPMLQQLISRPFEKEEELAQLKKDVSKLEREIAIKIQTNQMKQDNSGNENAVEIKEAPVIKMDNKELKPKNILLPKKEVSRRKEKTLRL